MGKRFGPTAPNLTLINDANGNPIDTKWADQVYQKGFQQNHAITFPAQLQQPTITFQLDIPIRQV